MDREIGPLPRAVNGEKAQRDDAHLIEMRIGRAEKFAGDFRRRVRADRLREMQIFRKRHRFRNAVNRRTRGEDETLDADYARRFEQVQRAADIRVVVKLRLR